MAPAVGENNATTASAMGHGNDTPMYPGLIRMSEAYGAIHGQVSCIICIFGVAANLANIVVLTRKNMASSTNSILLWLAVADLATMTSYLPFSIHFYLMRPEWLEFPSSPSKHWFHFLLFHASFTVVMHTVAIWLTIVLALFRYLYICHPTKGKDWCSQQRAKIAILAVYLSTIVACTPNYLVNAVKQNSKLIIGRNNSALLVTYYEFTHSSIGQPILNNINYWIQAFAIKLIPCVLLTVLTVLLVVAMHKANKRRMKLKTQGKKDESDRARETNRTTMMLLIIVALFLLTEMPQGILTLCAIFIPNFMENVYQPLGDLLDIAALLNNSINFVLYCTMSRQFRDTFVTVFCGCCRERRPGWLKLKPFRHSSDNNGTVTTSCAI